MSIFYDDRSLIDSKSICRLLSVGRLMCEVVLLLVQYDKVPLHRNKLSLNSFFNVCFITFTRVV
jgi:hypothetical protein